MTYGRLFRGLIGGLLLSTVSNGAESVIYVDDNAPPGGDGSSWATAYTYLQDALATARNRDEIHVAAGIYKPDQDEGGHVVAGDREASFELVNGTTVFGGFRGCPLEDCSIGNPNQRLILGYESLLSGDLAGDDSLNRANNAENSHHVVTSVGHNQTTHLDGFTISGGNANGLQMPLSCGGGMYYNGGTPTVTNCHFLENSAVSGGGMCNDGSAPTVTNCRFTGNTGETGGAIYNDGSQPTIVNGTFDGNVAALGSAVYDTDGSSTMIANCIFWNAGPSGPPIQSTTAVVDHSCIAGGYPGSGNIDIDPRFFIDGFWDDQGTPDVPEDDLWVPGNYHLHPESPCVNAGDSGSVPIDVLTDFEGGSRIRGCGVDMGVDETPHFGLDCNHNSVGDGCDIAQGSSPDCNFNGLPDECESDEDCNANGTQDICDIANLTSEDCDGNGIPDECDPVDDCNTNGVQDICDIAAGTSEDCNANRIPDECEPDEDCNANGSADICDLANATSADCNGNRIPDECEGPIIYVDDNAGGSGNGTSWVNAHTDLQLAIADALSCGQLFSNIRVAQGTYVPGPSRSDAFRLVNGVTVAGGYRGIDPAHPGDPDDRDIRLFETILSGDLAGDDGPGFANNGENSYHLFYHPFGLSLNETAILEGVVIRGGNANENSGTNGRGGGMHNDRNSPTVTHCTFVGNWAQLGGGGLYNQLNGPTVAGCIFSGNATPGVGGGVYNNSTTTATISCDFVGNLASFRGAAVYDFSNDGSTITNCVFGNNRALTGSQDHLFAIWNTAVTYNCIEGGHLGLGNIDADPQFVNDGEWNDNGTPEDTGDDFWVDGDYHLQAGSPCINAGRNDALPIDLTVDLDGDDRVQQCRVDMGVDETPDFRDCNANGTGDACDIAVGASGDCNDNLLPDDCESMADCNGNGVQDLCDLATGTSEDCNTNGLPDDCEPGGQADCDGDGQSDLCEIHLGTSPDCNGNGLADACDGPVIYVDDDATEGAHDGSSWTDAYTDLQDALAEAITCGIVFRQIHIAQGTYHPGEARTDYFSLIKGVTVSGGYRGVDTNTPGDPDDHDIALYVTVLSGDLDGDDFADPTGIQACFRGDGVQYLAGCEAFDEDGDGDVDAIDAHIDDNSFRVFENLSTAEIDPSGTLDGVTITGGNGGNLSGGGMLNSRVNPTVIDCTFDGNWGAWGGGMYNSSAGENTFPTLIGCTFRRNWAERGGGMFNRDSSPWLTDCVFVENRASTVGGAINNSFDSDARLTNCLLHRNYANWHGGGMYNYSSSSPVVSRCTISENVSRLSGGGLYNASNSRAHIDLCTFSRNIAGAPGGGIYNSSSKIQVSNSTFDGNSGNLGGGMYNQFSDPILFNTTFSGNVARNRGGAMYNRESEPRTVNCAFTGNTAVYEGGGIFNTLSEPTMTNCILWGNVPSEIFNLDSTPAITYSDVQGGYEGEGNIDADPRFVDNGHWDDGDTSTPIDDVWTPGDYHLQPDSPCINTGDNDNVILPSGSDFEGDDRIQHCRVDMGPDETPDYRDCNVNDNPDACDIAEGTSIDCNRNAVPDECDPDRDCNANGIQDICDVAAGTHADCNGNEIPDECEGPIVYVDDDATAGENNGTNWTDAFTDLQAAVADVLVCGPLFTEIRVAQGTYRPGSTRDSSFRLVNGITFAGGFRGIDPAHPGDPDDRDIRSFETVLSGDLASDDGPDVSTRSDNSYHVFYHPFGLALDETAVLDGATITGGAASTFNVSGVGGGMYNNSSSPTLINTTLVRNTGVWGGGMYNLDSHPTLTNCLLIGNKASVYGGGMINFNSGPVATNCTLVGNLSKFGGAIYSDLASTAIITNAILWGNSTTDNQQLFKVDALVNVTFSCLEGGYAGQGNIAANPRLVQFGYWDENATPDDTGDDIWVSGDYHLQVDSPCLDAGDNASVPPGITSDFEGDARIQHCRIDMGADEAPFFRDCNGNGVGDTCEIDQGTTGDCNANGIPDSCERFSDCNNNAVQDICDIAVGTSIDCNANLVPDECEGAIVYVHAGATGTNDGTSWANALTELQDALLGAAACGGRITEIRAAQGTYRPGASRSSAFQLVNGVNVAGGYRGVDPGNPGDPDDRDIRQFETILSCDLNQDDGPDFANTEDNCDHVLFHPEGLGLDLTAVLDGVTISGGEGGAYPWFGGGMYNRLNSPTVAHCAFRRNRADRGGGMYNEESNPVVTDCTFTENFAYDGGGVYNVFSAPTVTRCLFTRNEAYDGGGLYNRRSDATFTNCTFGGNSANYAGGVYNTDSSPTWTNCTFIANSAGIVGGMYNSYSDSTLTNCTFSANSSEAGYYGGLYNYSSETTLTNCVLWGDSPSQIYNEYSTPTVTYCNIENGFPGEGNLSSDPLFTRIPDPGLDGEWGTDDDDYGDLRPRPGSPCIDAGDPEFVPAPGERDLQGLDRVLCDRVDMGAFEFAGDFDCNQTLDLRDVAGLQTCFTGEDLGPYDSGCEAFDVDGDLDIDISDFAEFEKVFSQ